MGQQTCLGAVTRCSKGSAPSTLVVAPQHKVYTGMPAATVMDHQPLVNVLPFLMCRSLGNPMVAAATAAAMGSLKPMPCLPVTTSPWKPGSPTVKIGGQAALNNSSKLRCAWGGVIGIDMAGQFTVAIP
jgi:Domain of unknown function (DUF4280)